MTVSYSPSLTHALGEPDERGETVRLTPVTNAVVYGFVSCAHAQELLDAIQLMLGPDSWLECDDGSILQLRYVIKAEVWHK